MKLARFGGSFVSSRRRGATGGGGGGGGAYDSAAQDAYFDALYDAAFSGLTYSSTKYVSTTGSNGNSGNSLGAAYASVDYAVSQISANGLILVNDGSYTIGTSGWLNSTTGNTPPSGTGSNFTTIRAINPGAVTLSQSSQTYYGSILRVGGSRLWIDGINFIHNTSHPDEAIFAFGASDSRITRCMFRRDQSGTYGATFYLGDNSLMQDCALYGAGRYMCNTGSNSGDSVAGSNVFRRVIIRMDWALSLQPKAGFAHYGSDSEGWDDSKETLFANCFALDGPGFNGASTEKYAAFYHPKSTRDIRHRGCIVLNDGATHAAFSMDNIGPNTGLASDCAIWDLTNDNPGGASPVGIRSPGDSVFTIDHLTGGQIPGADTGGSGTVTNLTSNNHLWSDSPTNILQRSGGNGAEILYCHGAFLSHWGDSGFDTVTTDPLWPWPFEDRIKSWMDTQISLPGSHYPTTPSTSRLSFDGLDMNGDPMTPTRRAWQAAGNAIPDLSTVY